MESQVIARACCLGVLCLDRLAELSDDDQDVGPEDGHKVKPWIDNTFITYENDVFSDLSYLDSSRTGTAEKLKVCTLFCCTCSLSTHILLILHLEKC